ncbi:MAG: AAA family ATPase [Azonexus sp.]|nr:AAA family ATPase [Azonexus sp.]
MADFRVDQAAGLRRLFGGAGLQVIAFVAGCEGVGRSTSVANLGVALARFGKEVLIIDEHPTGDDIAASLGMLAAHDLLNVVQREMTLPQVLLRPMKGLSILPAARALRKFGRLTLQQQQLLVDAMSGLERSIDVILVDASLSHPAGFSPFGLVAQETVVVISGSSASITEAYALIKKVSHAFSRRHFRILVNKVRSQADARSIYDNIAQVARQRGVATLDYAGAIPLDEAMKVAGQLCRPVLFQAPDAPSAVAIRDLATDLQYWQQAPGEQGGVDHFLQQLLHLSHRITPHVLRA